MPEWLQVLFFLALFVWAVIASAAAVEAQDRCTRAQEREARLRREYFGEVSS